ncbi:MAG TPA: TrkA family potassium uptake protein [Brumimicrobium sp.]|nr:TrkA family potassium uptake protein [Brumimicrobium sp.]
MGFNKFAVIGVGKYGSNIARRLAEKGAQVFAFDNNEEKIENIKDDVAFAVTLNSTDFKVLSSQNLEEMDAAVVAIGENFEATILTAVHLIDLGVKRIIARANGADQRLILEKIGIKEILTPEDEVAFVVREKLLNPSILSFLQLSEEYEIAEIKPPKGTLNRTIEDIDFRNKYQLTLVTMRREYDIKKKGQYEVEQHVIGVPKGDTVIESRDTLVVFGTAKHVQRFIDVNES